MDLAELNTNLAELGRPPIVVGQLPGRSPEYLAADPWSLGTPLDRGDVHVTEFADEDAACRWLLTRELMEYLPRAGGHPRPPVPEADPEVRDHPPGGLRRDRATPPVLRWRRSIRPLTKPYARGSGVLILHDTSSLYQHGIRGAVYAVGLDVATGRRLWGVPLRSPSHHTRTEILDDVAVIGASEWWIGLGVATGEERWRIAAPPAGRLVAHHAGLAVVRLGDPAGLAGLDLRTGSWEWHRPGMSSDSAYAYDRITELSRVLCVAVQSGRMTLDAVRVSDGVPTRLVDVPESASHRGNRLILIDDMLDDAGRSGYALVRGRSGLGDLVLVPGRAKAIRAPAGCRPRRWIPSTSCSDRPMETVHIGWLTCPAGPSGSFRTGSGSPAARPG